MDSLFCVFVIRRVGERYEKGGLARREWMMMMMIAMR
jgi:hypothetical protein